jgi:HEAT repeat protein
MKYCRNASLIVFWGMLLLAPASALGASAPPKSTSTLDAAARAELGREALGVLAGRASDPDPEVRAAVAEAFAALGNKAAAGVLRARLKDDNADTRAAAAAGLHALGDVRGLTALIDETKPLSWGASKTPAEELRRMARDAARARAVLRLGEAAGPLAKEALENALQDPAGEVRDAAAVALGRLGREDVLTPFHESLEDPDAEVRAYAIARLGLVGRGARGKVLAAAVDVSTGVRAEAVLALGAYGDAGAGAAAANALKDRSGRVRLAAVRALARQDTPDSTLALKALLDGAPAPELALRATAALLERGAELDLSLPELTLAQRDPELRLLAVDALAASPRPEALTLLAKAMREDGDGRVRARAAQAVIARLKKGGR